MTRPRRENPGLARAMWRVVVMAGLTGGLVACGPAEDPGRTNASERRSVSVAQPPTAAPAGEPDDLGAASACAVAYAAAPFFGSIDVEPPSSPADAAEGAIGRVDGHIVDAEIVVGDPDSIGAVIDGEERSVELTTTDLRLEIRVDEATDGLAEAGAHITIDVPFTSDAPGAPDAAGLATTAVERCGADVPVTAYPQAVEGGAPGEAQPAITSSYAVLLTDGAERFVALNPFVATGEPYGVTTLTEFDDAATR